MKISTFMFFTDETIGPAELGRAVEERGLHALWVPEHPHIPTIRSTPVPAAYGGGELPRMYLRLLDPFVALTAAAAATTTLRVGTGVCLLALRDPIVTAKEIATLDLLSGGRFEFGVGYGWNADEFEDHGQSFQLRREVVRDRVALMRTLWSDDVATSDLEHAPMQPSWAWPKPLQRPGPPVSLGGNGPTTMAEAARWADRWFPTPSSSTLGDDVQQFRRLVESAGRDLADVGVGLAATPADVAFLSDCVEWGIEEVAVALPSAPAIDVMPVLDALAATKQRLGV
jgi:probable F420-dependent oxidoreductase